MANVTLARQSAVPAGAAPTFTTLNATDVYYVPKSTVLYFKNTNASPAVVTFDVTQSPEGLSVTDPTVSVPATTGERICGGFSGLYEVVGGAFDDMVKFSQDAATGCSVAAFAV
jgi:hypothetical protein